MALLYVVLRLFPVCDLLIRCIALVSSLCLHQRVNINCQHIWPHYMWYCACFKSILTEGEYWLSASMTSLYVVLRLCPVYTYIRGCLWIVGIYDLVICGIALVSSLYLHQRVNIVCQPLWPRYMWYCACFQSILTSEGVCRLSASMTSLYVVLRLFPVCDLLIRCIALVSSLYLHQRVNINC